MAKRRTVKKPDIMLNGVPMTDAQRACYLRAVERGVSTGRSVSKHHRPSVSHSQVCEALKAIRDRKLYLQVYPTWDEYCYFRHGMSPDKANAMISKHEDACVASMT